VGKSSRRDGAWPKKKTGTSSLGGRHPGPGAPAAPQKNYSPTVPEPIKNNVRRSGRRLKAVRKKGCPLRDRPRKKSPAPRQIKKGRDSPSSSEGTTLSVEGSQQVGCGRRLIVRIKNNREEGAFSLKIMKTHRASFFRGQKGNEINILKRTSIKKNFHFGMEDNVNQKRPTAPSSASIRKHSELSIGTCRPN